MNQMTIEFGVGKELRAARLEKELKLADIAKELNLKVEHLTAIEKDAYDELPGRTYVFGFVRCYARYLGLNDSLMVERLGQSGLVGGGAATVSEVEVAPEDNSEPVSENTVKIGLLVVGLVSVLVGIYAFVSTLDENETEVEAKAETVVEEKVEEAAEEEKEAAKPATSMIEKVLSDKAEQKVKAEKLKLVGTKPEGARVLLTAKEDAWYQVYHPKTKKVYQNAVLKKGHSVWVPNVKGVLMDLGRPHKMEIMVDGKSYGAAGPSWGGVIKKMSADANFLVYDYYGEGLNKKSFNRWLKKQNNQ